MHFSEKELLSYFIYKQSEQFKVHVIYVYEITSNTPLIEKYEVK